MLPSLRILSAALLFLAACSTAFGQTGAISGQILSGLEPVVQANVGLQGTPRGAVTDHDGKFTISRIPAGAYTLAVSAVGYKKLEQTVTVQEGKTLELKLQLEKTILNLDQVVVTGTMTETSVTDSPVKVEVVSPKLFRMNPTNNLTEALQTVNGLYNQVDCAVCGTNNIRINGMEGPYTAILIDGAPIMGSLASVYGFNGINPALIDQVEIVRGPSSTLYGSEAMGGVINIRTVNPRFAPVFMVDSYVSELTEKNLDFALAPKIGNNRTLISGSLYHMGKFVDGNGDNFTDVTQNTRLSLFNKWAFGSLDPKGLDLYFKYYYEDRMGGTSEFDRSIRGSGDVYGESILTNRFEAAATGTWRGANRVARLQASMSYHDQDSYYGDYGYTAQQNNYFVNATLDQQLGRRNSLLLGGSLRLEDLRQQFSSNAEFDGEDRRFIPGLFAQGETKPTTTLTLLAGLRADHYNEHGLILSPRASLRWQPFSGSTIRVNSGTGFRVVNLFTEEHEVITGVREIILEGDLNPERSRNVSVNFNQLINNGHSATTIDLDVYLTRFTDQIFPEYFSEDGRNYIVYRNAESYSVSRGVSLSITQNFDFPLSFTLGGTLQDVFVTEEDGGKRPLEYSSDFLGVFNGSYTLPTRTPVTFDWTGRVVGPMKLPEYDAPFERAPISPWFSEHNAQVTVKPVRGVETYFSVKNLFNYTQENPLIDPAHPFGDHFDTAYVYGPLLGRRFLVGVRYKLL